PCPSPALVTAMVEGDMTRLEQVVSNLLGNALKFTPPGGRIAISVEADANDAILSIKDSGIGIAPSLLSQVFEIFVQGSISLDRRQGGLGIGLSLVKALVEQHHGTIAVTSAGEGQGSCFVVRLPLLRAVKSSQHR
ncbi:MAG: ATP-binding protein, partial [Pseudomonadota bacterium]|nr:ATP-binding protein [Pseudomonadota bacterium]